MRRDLPAGTITLLFTDVEGSTKLLHELGTETYAEKLAEHRRIVREACTARGGVEVDTQGDAFFVAFPTAPEALEAARTITEELASGPITLRIGLHTGTPLVTEEGYVGEDVHFAARVAASAHGGQVVLSQATRTLIDEHYPLFALGEHRLKDIPELVAIFQLGDGQFPPLKTISNTNLPRPASSFVGRERELSELLARIEDGARVLTLTGPGGSGKTRLALEAAATLVPEYTAGVFWVGLASLREPALVNETIAQTLGAKDGLADHIAEREMLLLLDNLEHVIEAAPDLSSLIQGCPNLTLLVTSRELMRVQGEVEYPVPPLAQAEAVTLFCERAQAEASEEISELCLRLDNLPLAVELAAARAKSLSPSQILERLSQRLDLLKGGRDADPRQQTLRATIAWSYDLLSEHEQQLFRRLGVFAGGCTLEAAEEVSDAELDVIQSLVEKSLVRFSNSRYWMLETIREYALARLEEAGESSELWKRHARHFLDLAEQADPEIRDHSDTRWLSRLESEHPNLRAAIGHAVATDDSETALALVGALAYFWWMHGYISEGRRWLDAALVLPPKLPTRVRGRALNGAAALAVHAGDLPRGGQYSEESLEIWQTLDDWDGTVRALNELGKVATAERQFERAEKLYTQAIELAHEHDPLWVVVINNNRAEAVLEQGDFEKASALFEETVADARKHDYRLGLLFAILGNGHAARALGQEARLRDLLAEALPISVELGHKEGVFTGLVLAADLIKRPRPDEAALLLGAATSIRAESGFADSIDLDVYDGVLADLHELLGVERTEEALKEGAVLGAEEAATHALQLLSDVSDGVEISAKGRT